MKHALTIVLFYLCALAYARSGPAGHCWRVIPSESRISFAVDQAGAPLQGTFASADGTVCLGTDAYRGRARVTVQTSSVRTALPQLDDALRGADFFNVSRWPRAVFESDDIERLGEDRYEAKGQLRVRDVRHDLTVGFALKPEANGRRAALYAEFTIKRLNYGIGQGQWSDTQWVSDGVHVVISATLDPSATDLDGQAAGGD